MNIRLAPRRAALLATLAVLLTSVVTIAMPTTSRAVVTTPADDRSVAEPTAWWTYSNITTADLTAKLATNGARLTELEPFDASAGTWSAVMVPDTGSYYVSGWWWYVGQTAADIATHVTANSARLIDLSPYSTSGGTRFAVIMVSNAGADARDWAYRVAASSTGITTLVNSGQRLIDLSTYVESGSTKYAIVTVANTGADAKTWQWWAGQTAAQVTSRINSFSGRLVDLTVGPTGLFNIILVKNTGGDLFYWRWFSSVGTADRLTYFAQQYGSRLLVVEPYLVAGARRFAGVIIDNSNASTRAIRSVFEVGNSLISSTGTPRATWGAYVKEVGGPVTTDLESDLPFEPASAIKVVHSLTVVQHVQDGTDGLADPFVYYDYPDSPIAPNTGGTCPVDQDETPANARTNLTLNGGRQVMMSQSDNRTTRGIVLKYGLAAVQATAAAAGMTATTIDQARIGCEFRGGRNFTTLADLGRVFEGIEDHTLLSSAYAQVFYNPMEGNTFNGEGAETGIANIVRAEAAALGKSGAVADDFISRMNWRFKRGGYWIHCGDPGTTCSTGVIAIVTSTGRLTLPVKTTAGADTSRAYVFGRFIDNAIINCVGCLSGTTVNDIGNTVDQEMFRDSIRSALETY